MTLRVFIDGMAGTTGLEIDDRLRDRPEFELLRLDEVRRKDVSARSEALNAADVAILCLPDEAAREAVGLVTNSRTRIIDASSAHRVTESWTYGFPELGHDVANATRVSNPGCYPTGFLALVAPLVRAKIIPADWPLTVNAVSGYSGGGKALIRRFAEERALAFRTYALDLEHKHRAEMKLHAGLEHGVIFAPSVVPAFRGMVVEVPLHLGAMPGRVTVDTLRSELRQFYAGSSVIHVASAEPLSEIVLSQDAAASDAMTLHVRGNAGGYHARLIAVLDNLGKGASGAVVQTLNLMAGLPQTTGLRLSPA